MIFNAPKDFKRGRLIANKYTLTDLLIAGTGVTMSLILEIIFFIVFLNKSLIRNLAFAVLFLLPAGISILFVVPNGIYHNIFTFLELKAMNLRQPKMYIYEGIKHYGSDRKEETKSP